MRVLLFERELRAATFFFDAVALDDLATVFFFAADFFAATLVRFAGVFFLGAAAQERLADSASTNKVMKRRGEQKVRVIPVVVLAYMRIHRAAIPHRGHNYVPNLTFLRKNVLGLLWCKMPEYVKHPTSLIGQMLFKL